MPIAATEPEATGISSRLDQRPGPRPRVLPQPEIDRALRADFLIANLAVAGISAHLVLVYGFKTSSLTQLFPLYIVLILGGVPLIIRLTGKVFAREFGSDVLAGISIAVSVLMGQYLVGSIVVLMLSGGTALETFATRRASSLLKALAQRMPHGPPENKEWNHRC